MEYLEMNEKYFFKCTTYTSNMKIKFYLPFILSSFYYFIAMLLKIFNYYVSKNTHKLLMIPSLLNVK